MRVKRDYVLFSVMHFGDHRLWPSGQEIEGNTKGISGLGLFRSDDVNHSFFLDERSSEDIFEKMFQVWLDPRLLCTIPSGAVFVVLYYIDKARFLALDARQTAILPGS